MTRTRWGIAGTGGIAANFAADLARLDDAELVAVGSRSAATAKAFAERWHVPHRHASYDDLAADPDVDVVYVASPNSRHEPDTLRFLEAGKHVLCEKPFALNTAQATRMIEAARERGLFLMEAMWSRFLPSYRTLVGLIGEGRIGEPLLVEGDFGFRSPLDPSHRLFDPALGGGGLLDLGVYPLQLCLLVLGAPQRVVADGRVGETGVDESVAAVLGYDDGRLGVIKAAVRVNLACTARISGTDGVIELPAMLHCPSHLHVQTLAGRERIDAPWEGHGLRFQAQEVHRCLAAGLTESPTMSHAETLTMVGILDTIRHQLGVTYPSE